MRRAEAAKARFDTRSWVMQRRARTRRLIELGGLVAKSGLEDAIAPHEPDTRAVILGALLELAEAVRTQADDTEPRTDITAWCARGRWALRSADRDPDTESGPDAEVSA
jgi:hypothetical protein